MTWYRCMGGTGGGIPSSLQSGMDSVLNKKFGTTGQTYISSGWPGDVNVMGLLPVETASGAIAHFTDGADDVPLADGKFSITAYQDGTGTPSPSNVRAIHGYTGMNIHVADGETPHVIDNIYPLTWQTECFGGYIQGEEVIATYSIVDLGSLSWVYYSSNGVFANSVAVSNCVINPKACICSSYEFNGNANSTLIANMAGSLSDYQMCAYSNNDNKGRFVVKDSRYTSAGDFTTSVTGVKLIFPLNTPVKLADITPVEISTLNGENNIWNTCGDTEVSYRAQIPNVRDITAALVNNTYIGRQDGAELPYSDWSSTDFVEIVGGETITVASSYSDSYNAYYDANKNFINSFSVDVGVYDYTVPANARYARYSSSTTFMQHFRVYRYL